jgi:hypothetical protein
MELSPYVQELQRQLAVAAQAAGEEGRAIADRLIAPLDAAARLMLLEALSSAAGEISAELAPGSVDVRLRGRDPEFVVVAPSAPAFTERDTTTTPDVTPSVPPSGVGPAQAPAAGATDDTSTTRTTLRLPDQLKAQVEAAAVREGVSLNTWLVRAVAAALEPAGPPLPGTAPAVADGRRVTGWAR